MGRREERTVWAAEKDFRLFCQKIVDKFAAEGV